MIFNTKKPKPFYQGPSCLKELLQGSDADAATIAKAVDADIEAGRGKAANNYPVALSLFPAVINTQWDLVVA